MNFTNLSGIIFFFCTLVLKGSCRPLNIIKDLLRNNVAGPAVNFQSVSWPVDPDAGLRRRIEYEAVNGRYGYKHVERIGLGEDGRTEERRLQQRLRDEMGALSYQPPMELKCLKKIKCDQGAVRAIRFNVDGCYCLTCGSDKKIKLWNPYKALHLKTYGGHANDVTDACGSCDSSQIISCGADKSVILWDVSSGQIIRRFRGHAGKVTCVKFNEESTLAISGSQDNTVIFWDIKSRKNDPIQVLKDAKDGITSLQITDHEILVGSLDGLVRCYDVRAGQFFSDFIGDPVTCASFTKDSQCILVSSENIIRLMDKQTGELLSEYKGHMSKDYLIESCTSRKDSYVLSGSADGNMWCWELISSKCYKKLSHSPDKVVHSISPHPTKDIYLTAAGGNIYLWCENSEENEDSEKSEVQNV